MPEIFGESMVRVRERTGRLQQAVRIERFIESDGTGYGSRRLRLVNGGGIELDIHPDRALDIGHATVDGRPVAWSSPVGFTGPEAAEPHGFGWLRTFGGGLLATCGLDSFGVPSEEEGQSFGQHGRIGTQRAEIIRTEVTEREVVVEGIVRQARVFGEHLVLRRRITSLIGSDTIIIEDEITNASFEEQPHMILYHLNLGWPLLGDRTAIDIPAKRVIPRDAAAKHGMDDRAVFGPPRSGFQEQVFTHDLADGNTRIVVANPDNGLSFELEVDAEHLPHVFQWKMAGEGHYALGIEPANTPHLFGRASARVAGELPVLGPGEHTSYRLVVRLRHDPPTQQPREEEPS